MQINPFQHAVLTQMGITLWRLRDDAPECLRQLQAAELAAEAELAEVKTPVSAPVSETVTESLTEIVSGPVAEPASQPLQAAELPEVVVRTESQPESVPESEPGADIQQQPQPAEPVMAQPIEPEPVVAERENLFERDDEFVFDVKCCLPHDVELRWVEGAQFAVDGKQIQTPALSLIKQSAELKQQLWQVIQAWQS